jgi:hypothetical protein
MLILFYNWTQLSNTEFIYTDLFTTVILFITLGLTDPAEKLSP